MTSKELDLRQWYGYFLPVAVLRDVCALIVHPFNKCKKARRVSEQKTSSSWGLLENKWFRRPVLLEGEFCFGDSEAGGQVGESWGEEA